MMESYQNLKFHGRFVSGDLKFGISTLQKYITTYDFCVGGIAETNNNKINWNKKIIENKFNLWTKNLLAIDDAFTIKLGLMMQYVKPLNKNGDCFVATIFPLES